MIQRILLPLDQLDPLHPALQAAQRFFPAAQVLLLHVLIPSLPMAAHGGFVPIPPDSAFNDTTRLEAEDALHMLGSGEVTIAGGVISEILRRANSGHFDLILMGTAGKSGLLRFLLGSVSEGVIRDSPIPVMTVRAAPDAAPENAPPFRSGVVLTDFTPWSERALTYLHATFPQTEWQNLHVVPDDTGRAYLPMSLTGVHLPPQYNEERLQEAEQHLAETGGGEVRLGDPAKVVLGRAHSGEVDIVAIGTQPRSPLERLLFGAVAAQVIRESPVPVLIARARHTA